MLREIDEQISCRKRKSNFNAMLKDAQRYLPVMSDARHVDSLWDIRTVLPQSEESDSRPILFVRDCGLSGFHCVSGAKIDNVFDLLERLDDK
jgi:hypothetical protein